MPSPLHLVVLWVSLSCAASPAGERFRPVAAEPGPGQAAACSETQAPPATPLRRLSVREYKNTLRDLLDDDERLQPAFGRLELEFAQLPADGERGEIFPANDHRLSERHAATFVRVALKIADELSSDPGRLTALAGNCALSEPPERECLRRFLGDFGARVLRRPLTEEEQDQWLSEVRPGQQPFRQLLARLLSAPEFLFHVEQGRKDEGSEAGWVPLTGHELASRLAYHFWQTTPDRELLAAAGSGQLLSEAGYRTELDRLTEHQRARAVWYRFFRHWLGLEAFHGFSLDRAFHTLAGKVDTSEALYDDAVWEVEQLVAHYTFEQRGSFEDLLTSDVNLTRSRRLAELYGVAPWDGRSAPTSFPAGERSGLLTRAAVLISANHRTNPFERGAFIQRNVLCREIEPPSSRPPEAFELPPFDASLSTRQRYEQKESPADCKGCHVLFSPFGYALEGYDALGRFRAEERLIDDEGRELGRREVNDAARLRIAPRAIVDVNGPVELSRALADDETAVDCFVRQYFRFTFRRTETARDACTLSEMRTALAGGGLWGLYRGVAETHAFRHRGGVEPASHQQASTRHEGVAAADRDKEGPTP